LRMDWKSPYFRVWGLRDIFLWRVVTTSTPRLAKGRFPHPRYGFYFTTFAMQLPGSPTAVRATWATGGLDVDMLPHNPKGKVRRFPAQMIWGVKVEVTVIHAIACFGVLYNGRFFE